MYILTNKADFRRKFYGMLKILNYSVLQNSYKCTEIPLNKADGDILNYLVSLGVYVPHRPSRLQLYPDLQVTQTDIGGSRPDSSI